MKRTPLDSSLDCQTASYTKCISGFLLTILSPLSKKHTPHNKVHNSPIWKTDSPKNIPGDKRGQINKALQETWHTLAPLCRTLHKRDQINKALQETWHTLAPLCRTLHKRGQINKALQETWHTLAPLCRTLHKRDQINKALQETWHTLAPLCRTLHKRDQINKALQETWHTLAPLCRTLHKRDQINKALQETWHTLAPLCRTLHTASRRGEAGSHCLSPLVLFQYQPHNEVADADADHLHGGGESHGCAHCRPAHHQRNGGPHGGLKIIFKNSVIWLTKFTTRDVVATYCPPSPSSPPKSSLT